VGIDFSLAMVQAARGLHPGPTFMQGDAEALEFDDESFDAVVCSFGVNHLPHPEKAIREANRVLRPGGKFAFSMWCAPGKSKFHQLVLDSIRTHGTMDVPLPPAPPPFRFSDPATCIAELTAAGFHDPDVAEVPLSFRASAAADVPGAREERRSLADDDRAPGRPGPGTHPSGDRRRGGEVRAGALLEIPMPAVVASAVKGFPHQGLS
jgi:SAM-dependent methyltransferase